MSESTPDPRSTRSDDDPGRAEAIPEGERRFRDLANAMPQIVWTASSEGAVDYFNSRWYEYTGMTPEESLGEGWRASVHPDDIGRFSVERNRGLGEGDVFECEVRLHHRSGAYRWHLIRSAPLRDQTGRVVRRSGAATDIDDRKRAEAALVESEGRFARFMEHLPGLAWIKDAEGRYVYANEAAERVFGTPRTELYGRTDDEVFPPETAAQFRRNDRRALETGEGIQAVETLKHLDGEIHSSLVSKFPIPGLDDEAGLVGGIAIDISERLRAEEAIRESEFRYRNLADAMPQMVWVTRPDRSVEYVNRRWLDYTGQTPEVALGPGGWQSAIHPDDLGRIVETSIRSHVTGEPFEAEYRVKDASGAYRWHLGRAVPSFDEEGRLVRRFGAATDIDDRRRAEQDARFLAEASATSSALVDEAETLEKVAHLAVPAFADWCSVDLADESGLPRRLAVAHVDPAKVDLRPRTPPPLPARPGIPERRLPRHPHRRVAVGRRDHRRDAGRRRPGTRTTSPSLRELGLEVVPLRPAQGAWRHAWGDHVRRRRVGPPVRPGRPPTGRGPGLPSGDRHRERPALRRAAGGRPPQGRVPRHPGPRASQPAGPDPQRPAPDEAARRRRPDGGGAGDGRAAGRPPGPADRRPDGRGPDHPGQDRPAQGGRGPGARSSARRSRPPAPRSTSAAIS